MSADSFAGAVDGDGDGLPDELRLHAAIRIRDTKSMRFCIE
jgi:hypothetical protein